MSADRNLPTGPQTPITLGDLRTAIFDRLDGHESRQASRLNELEAKNVERHQTIVNQLNKHEQRLNEHDSDIDRLQGGRFPQTPLWALVAVTAIGAILTFGVLIFLVTHAHLAPFTR